MRDAPNDDVGQGGVADVRIAVSRLAAPPAVIRSRLMVSPPSRTATTTDPSWGSSAVDDQLVAVADSRLFHGVPGHQHHAGAGDVLDRVLVQVDRAFKSSPGRATESPRDRYRGHSADSNDEPASTTRRRQQRPQHTFIRIYTR